MASSSSVGVFETPFKTCADNIDAIRAQNLPLAEENIARSVEFHKLICILASIGEDYKHKAGNPSKWIAEHYYKEGDEEDAPESLEEINASIKELVASTPLSLVDCLGETSEVEIEAFKKLKFNGEILEAAAKSYKYSKFVIDYCEESRRTRNSRLEALKCLYHMNLFNLKALKFGLEEAPPTEEERQHYLERIDANTVCQKEFPYCGFLSKLDRAVPWWKLVPQLQITGSSISHFFSFYHAMFYAANYIWTRDATAYEFENSNFQWQKLSFPVEGGGVYSLSKQGDLVKKEGLLECPTCSYTNLPRGAIMSTKHVSAIVPGTDLDVPVFDETELDTTAETIFEAVKTTYPQFSSRFVLEKKQGPKGYTWSIYMEETLPEGISAEEAKDYITTYINFRRVEVYITTKHHIYTHHVAPARAFLRIEEGNPVVYADPSFTLSLETLAYSDYHYFAGKKSSPLEVILRYSMRGFRPPAYTNSLVEKGMRHKGHQLPVGIVL